MCFASHDPTPDEMDAYERLLGAAMDGDPTLFARQDYVEEAWRIVDPVWRSLRSSIFTSRVHGGLTKRAGGASWRLSNPILARKRL